MESVTNIVNLPSDGPCHMVVSVSEDVSAHEVEEFSRAFKAWAPEGVKVLFVKGMAMLEGDGANFVHAKLNRGTLVDADGDNVDMAVWAHLPTGLVCSYRRPDFAQVLTKHKAPLTFTPWKDD